MLFPPDAATMIPIRSSSTIAVTDTMPPKNTVRYGLFSSDTGINFFNAHLPFSDQNCDQQQCYSEQEKQCAELNP